MVLCSTLLNWPTAFWNAPSCAWLPFSRLCSSCLSSWSCCTWTCSSSHLLLHCCSFCCSSCTRKREVEFKWEFISLGQNLLSVSVLGSWVPSKRVCHFYKVITDVLLRWFQGDLNNKCWLRRCRHYMNLPNNKCCLSVLPWKYLKNKSTINYLENSASQLQQ